MTIAARPWRLVPELDRFDDAECATICDRLATTRSLALLLAVPIAAVVGGSLFAVGEIVADRLEPRHGMDTDVLLGRVEFVTTAIVMIAGATFAGLLPYCVILRAAIRKRIASVRCPGCNYVLLGLPIESGRVKCPECGLIIELAAQGVRPEDLETGTQVRGGHVPTTGWSRFSIACAGGLIALLAAWTLTGWGPLLGAAALALFGPLMSLSGTVVLSQPGSGSGRSS